MFAMGSSVKFSTRFFILRHLPGMAVKLAPKRASMAQLLQQSKQLQHKRVPTTSSCLAAIPLELTKKAFSVLLVVGPWFHDLLIRAHLFGNHRPSFKIDNQRLVLVVLTHCFQSSSSTATLKAKQVLKMAGFWQIFRQQFCLNYLFESQSSCGSSRNNI